MSLYTPNCKMLSASPEGSKPWGKGMVLSYVFIGGRCVQQYHVWFWYSADAMMAWFTYSGDVKMVWFWHSGDVKMVWFWYSGDVSIVWFCPSGEVKMVWFWYSGDVGIVWFCPSGDVKDGMIFGFLGRRWFSLVFPSGDVKSTLRLPSWHNFSRVIPYVSRGRKSLGRRKIPWLGYSWKNSRILGKFTPNIRKVKGET